MISERATGWTSALLLALGALRLFLLVLHDPMLGYANNYDFVRISSWFDLWADPNEAPDDFDPRRQYPSAPVSTYRIAPEIRSEHRYVTSDLIFVRVALAIGKGLAAVTGAPADRFDLRALGALRAFCLTAAAVFVTLLFARRSASAGLVSASIFALVLADPAVSLLFNTLYSDYSTVLFGYLGAAAAIHAIAFGPLGVGGSIALALVLALLAASKAQYGPLGLLLGSLVLGATWLLHPRTLRRASTGIGLGLLLCGATAGWIVPGRLMGTAGYAWSMRMATATDTYLGAVLPQMRDVHAGLRLLGLPESCAPYVGKTWYDPGMQPPPCPEVERVPRSRIASVILHEPLVAFRMARRALPLLQPLVARNLGQVEGERYGQAELRLASGLPSAAPWVAALPGGVFAACLLVTLAAPFLSLVGLMLGRARAWPGTALLLPALLAVVGTIEWYAFVSALFGDGYVDFARHSFLGQLAFLILAFAVPWQLAQWVLKGRGA